MTATCRRRSRKTLHCRESARVVSSATSYDRRGDPIEHVRTSKTTATRGDLIARENASLQFPDSETMELGRRKDRRFARRLDVRGSRVAASSLTPGSHGPVRPVGGAVVL